MPIVVAIMKEGIQPPPTWHNNSCYIDSLLFTLAVVSPIDLFSKSKAKKNRKT